jgi:hypothetical protein
MDIGKDGQPHISSPSIIALALARALRDIKQQAACGVQSGRVALQVLKCCVTAGFALDYIRNRYILTAWAKSNPRCR